MNKDTLKTLTDLALRTHYQANHEALVKALPDALQRAYATHDADALKRFLSLTGHFANETHVARVHQCTGND